MKKNTAVLMLVILLAGVSLVYAAEKKDSKMEKGMMGKGMMGGGMMDGKMMGMHGMMMKMMERSVVATSDGGVVVLMGNTLTKYDKDLNVVKEVELKMDMKAMHEKMEEMMKTCPMMGKVMKDDDNDDEAAEKSEHEGHHK